MKPLPILILLFFTVVPSFPQAQMSRIEQTIDRLAAESHLRFLASDELKGRNTGTSELNIAGRYIAEQFRKFGVEPLGDQDGDYQQQVYLHTATSPVQASVELSDRNFSFGEDMAIVSGNNGTVEAPILFLKEDSAFADARVKGKIVVKVLGDLRAALGNVERVKELQDAGALGLIEIFGPGQQFPWPLVMKYLNREKMNFGKLEENAFMPHIWLNDTASVLIRKIKEASVQEARLVISGIEKTPIETYNIIGKIEGTDPDLKQEHIIMCAHYDHVGIQQGEGQDSIYNGTRDNAVGTTGLINAARYFGKHPPKRSILLIALTAEEKGLLGSQYYTQHPKVPLRECVFALNIDNSGYTNTEVITLLDTARTNIDELVYQAAAEIGLGVIGDRLPKQNYYERSDQVSFAIKGVPAVNFKMAMTDFDERITKYYHQPSDEVNTVDLDYIYKYWLAYLRTAELVGNWSETPYWRKGDKFEAAGNKLYNLEK